MLQLLCRYGFVVRGLNGLQLETNPDNMPMIRSAERVGFSQEGVLRQATWTLGSFADAVIMGLLAKDWHDAKPKRGGRNQAPGVTRPDSYAATTACDRSRRPSLRRTWLTYVLTVSLLHESETSSIGGSRVLSISAATSGVTANSSAVLNSYPSFSRRSPLFAVSEAGTRLVFRQMRKATVSVSPRWVTRAHRPE